MYNLRRMPRRKPVLAERNPSNWWQGLSTGERVLALIGCLTLIAASLIVPEVRKALRLKDEPVVVVPAGTMPKPPLDATRPESDDGKQPTKPPPLKVVPLPNAQPVVEQRKLFAKRVQPGHESGTPGLLSTAVPPALDPSIRTFVVASDLTVAANGKECALTAGDVITRITDTPDEDNAVSVRVLTSKKSDCPATKQ